MSGHRPGRHTPWRTRPDNAHPHLVAVRQAGHKRYEVTLSPGAGVADVVAAAGTLPHGVVYTTHRPPTPEQPTAAVLVFQKPPADPGGLGGVPARPSPAGEPPPPPGRLLANTDTDADPAGDGGGVPAAAEHALALPATPAAAGIHGRHPAHTRSHHDPDTPPTASDPARHQQHAA